MKPLGRPVEPFTGQRVLGVAPVQLALVRMAAGVRRHQLQRRRGAGLQAGEARVRIVGNGGGGFRVIRTIRAGLRPRPRTPGRVLPTLYRER